MVNSLGRPVRVRGGVPVNRELNAFMNFAND